MKPTGKGVRVLRSYSIRGLDGFKSCRTPGQEQIKPVLLCFKIKEK